MNLSLIELKTGKSARIISLNGETEFKSKLATLNIRLGKVVRKVAMHPLKGPLVIEIDNTKATIGRGMALKIIVEQIEE